MNQVKVIYNLSELGQRNAIVSGLSGNKVQTVYVDVTPELVNKSLVRIDMSGDMLLELNTYSHPYFSPLLSYATPSVSVRTELRVSTLANWEHPSLKFDFPLTTTDQVIAVLDDIDREIVALESTREAITEQWRLEDEERLRWSLEREMTNIQSKMGINLCSPKEYFPAEFNAEIEAANAKVLEKVAKDNDIYEKAKAKEEAEKARAEEEAEKVKEAFEKEMISWIKERGSDYLKLAHKEKYDCLRLYATERAAVEFPGFELMKLGQFKRCCCPSELALRESVVLTAAYNLPVRVVWHNNAEALLIRNFLGGRYDLMKVPTPETAAEAE